MRLSDWWTLAVLFFVVASYLEHCSPPFLHTVSDSNWMVDGLLRGWPRSQALWEEGKWPGNEATT